MRVPTLMMLLCLPAIHGCSDSVADAVGIGSVLQQIDAVNQLRCPELAAADVRSLKRPPPERPWTETTGATRGQLQSQIDTLELDVRRKNAAGERAIAEHARCRGAEPKPAQTS